MTKSKKFKKPTAFGQLRERLNGLVAIQLAQDAEYLRDIAYKAVTTYRDQKVNTMKVKGDL